MALPQSTTKSSRRKTGTTTPPIIHAPFDRIQMTSQLNPASILCLLCDVAGYEDSMEHGIACDSQKEFFQRKFPILGQVSDLADRRNLLCVHRREKISCVCAEESLRCTQKISLLFTQKRSSPLCTQMRSGHGIQKMQCTPTL